MELTITISSSFADASNLLGTKRDVFCESSIEAGISNQSMVYFRTTTTLGDILPSTHATCPTQSHVEQAAAIYST